MAKRNSNAQSPEPAPEPVRIDTVRASREGHTYHDTWTARVALELLIPTGGVHALAIVARLADREKAALALSLPPLLTSLVKHGRLGADFAVGLIGLDSPAETWSWSLLDFANAVIPRVAPALRSEAMDHLLTEIDRRYQASPPRDTLQGSQVAEGKDV